ncbi:hypothetical protein CBL_09381 [Carabus blaptoides fortunei]
MFSMLVIVHDANGFIVLPLRSGSYLEAPELAVIALRIVDVKLKKEHVCNDNIRPEFCMEFNYAICMFVVDADFGLEDIFGTECGNTAMLNTLLYAGTDTIDVATMDDECRARDVEVGEEDRHTSVYILDIYPAELSTAQCHTQQL